MVERRKGLFLKGSASYFFEKEEVITYLRYFGNLNNVNPNNIGGCEVAAKKGFTAQIEETIKEAGLNLTIHY